MSDLVVVLVVLPLLGGAAALAAKLPPVARRPAAARALVLVTPLGLAAGAAALAVLFPIIRGGEVLHYALGGWPAPLGIVLAMDGLAWISSALVYGLSFLIALYALSYRSYGAEFFVFYALLVGGMQAVVLTTDIFNLFVSFEIVAISAYVLIAYHREGTALVAAFKYLILSSVGIFFFLFGAFLIYRELGTLALAEVGMLYAAADPARTQVLRLALVALVVGVGVRTAFIPFHTWLPEAHAYAPHPISALLSGVLIKVSFFAMIRIIIAFDPRLFAGLLLWIGAVTAVVAVVWALSQRDAKKLLAYHSISQMGYVLAALGAALAAAAGVAPPGGGAAGIAAHAGAAFDTGAAGAIGLSASVYHAVNHGLFKSLLFLAVGTAVYMTGERDVYRMQPVGRRTPLLAVLFAVGALSIAGIPGFNGYASKAAVAAALEGSPAYILLQLTAVGTVASFIKLSRIFRRGAKPAGASQSPAPADTPAASGPAASGPARLPLGATAGMGLLALLCITAGIAPGPTVAILGTMLAPGAGAAAAAPVADAFAPSKLLDTVVIVALGVVVFLLVRSTGGQRVTHRVERMAPQLRTVLLFFYAGLTGFALVALAA